jgi:hypothetical protein
MLLVQAQKSHVAVSLLAQHGFMEDTATLASRLLEVSVQAIYIDAEGDADRRALLAAHLEVREPVPVGPSAGPKANAPGPTGIPTRLSADVLTTFKERATGLEPATSSSG